MAASRSSDATFGVYGHAGVNFRLNRHQNVGIEYRAVVASDLDVFGISSDADYSQVSLIFSASF